MKINKWGKKRSNIGDPLFERLNSLELLDDEIIFPSWKRLCAQVAPNSGARAGQKRNRIQGLSRVLSRRSPRRYTARQSEKPLELKNGIASRCRRGIANVREGIVKTDSRIEIRMYMRSFADDSRILKRDLAWSGAKRSRSVSYYVHRFFFNSRKTIGRKWSILVFIWFFIFAAPSLYTHYEWRIG